MIAFLVNDTVYAVDSVRGFNVKSAYINNQVRFGRVLPGPAPSSPCKIRYAVGLVNDRMYWRGEVYHTDGRWFTLDGVEPQGTLVFGKMTDIGILCDHDAVLEDDGELVRFKHRRRKPFKSPIGQFVDGVEILNNQQASELVGKYIDGCYVYDAKGNRCRVVERSKDSIHVDSGRRLRMWWDKAPVAVTTVRKRIGETYVSITGPVAEVTKLLEKL